MTNTYLYTFTSKSFDPDTVPLKWDPVQLLHGHFVLYQDVSYSGNANSGYNGDSCCWVNRRWCPPPEGLLVIL